MALTENHQSEDESPNNQRLSQDGTQASELAMSDLIDEDGVEDAEELRRAEKPSSSEKVSVQMDRYASADRVDPPGISASVFGLPSGYQDAMTEMMERLKQMQQQLDAAAAAARVAAPVQVPVVAAAPQVVASSSIVVATAVPGPARNLRTQYAGFLEQRAKGLSEFVNVSFPCAQGHSFNLHRDPVKNQKALPDKEMLRVRLRGRLLNPNVCEDWVDELADDVYREYSGGRSIKEITEQSMLGYLAAHQLTIPFKFVGAPAQSSSIMLLDDDVYTPGDDEAHNVFDHPFVRPFAESWKAHEKEALEMVKEAAESISNGNVNIPKPTMEGMYRHEYLSRVVASIYIGLGELYRDPACCEGGEVCASATSFVNKFSIVLKSGKGRLSTYFALDCMSYYMARFCLGATYVGAESAREFKQLFRAEAFNGLDLVAKLSSMTFAVDECWFDGYERIMAVVAEGRQRSKAEHGSAFGLGYLSSFNDHFVAMVLRRAIILAKASDDTDLDKKKELKDRVARNPGDFDTPEKVHRVLLDAHRRGLFLNGKLFQREKPVIEVSYAVQTRGAGGGGSTAAASVQRNFPVKAGKGKGKGEGKGGKGGSKLDEIEKASAAVREALGEGFSKDMESIKNPFGGRALFRFRLNKEKELQVSSGTFAKTHQDKDFELLCKATLNDPRIRDAELFVWDRRRGAAAEPTADSN